MLILEGGAGGHMRHPFDLDDVATGKDLVSKFFQIAEEIKAGNLPDTKIDGVNTSIKLVDTPEGKQFAMDRGSGQPLDVQGITLDKLTQKFAEGHGMIGAGKTVLGIFNDALPEITQELKALGLYDDPSKFFNMEYVKGTTNVLSYDHDFLKIHGVNQFYEKSIRGTPVRPGLERPLDPETNKPIKDPSTPVDYDESAMNSMVEKLNKYSGKYGFKVYSSIPSKAVKEFDFSQVASQPAPVTISAGNIDQQTLGQRLQVAKNRIGEEVLLETGKKIPAQGKEIYKAVLGASAADKNADPARQIPLDQLLANKEDYQKAIDGAVFWHATRLLGNVIIDAMEVDHPAVSGPAADHEGMVIYLKGDNFATKITGEFILGGEASSFRKEEPEDQKEAEPAVQAGKTIALFPGSFKPPHVGHMAVVKALASEYDEVIVLVSDPKEKVRSNITAQQSEEIFNIYIKELGIANAKAIASTAPSPIRAAYDIIEKEKFAPNTTLVIATSTKDSGRYPQAVLDKSAAKNPTRPSVKEATIPAITTGSGKAFSATDFRNTIKAVEGGSAKPEALYQFMPDISDSAKQQIASILLGSTQPVELTELLNIISEIASMAAGSVEGVAGGFGKLLKRKKKQKGITAMNEEEQELRQVIKNAIRLYKQEQLKEFKKSKLEEQQLRFILRKLIMEVGDEQPVHDNTGINVLEDLLKKIIPIIQTDYKIMTTSETQRLSFRAHILNAVQNSLKPELYRKEEAPPGAPSLQEKKVKIDLEDADVELDKSKFIDVFDTEKKKAEEDEKLKTPESRLSAGLEKEKLDSTGRNMALQTFKKVDNSITDAYTILDDAKDKDLFYDYLITNLKLYFDKFEEEMLDMPNTEPTTPEYTAEKEKKEQEDAPVEA